MQTTPAHEDIPPAQMPNWLFAIYVGFCSIGILVELGYFIAS